jgi:competence protein ComGC
MIQLKDKKIIIVIGVILFLVLISLFLLLRIDNKENKIYSSQSGQDEQVRLMTNEEKEARGLDKNQVLQVVNDKGGHFIYKVVK